MFDKIEEQNAKLHITIKDPDKFGFTKRVVFDKVDRYVALLSHRSLQIYSL